MDAVQGLSQSWLSDGRHAAKLANAYANVNDATSAVSDPAMSARRRRGVTRDACYAVPPGPSDDAPGAQQPPSPRASCTGGQATDP